MSNHRQSVRPFPCTNTAIFARVWHKHSKIRGDLDSIQGPHYIKIKNTGNTANKGTFWFFQDHLYSFQDPCLNLHKFNIFWLYLVHFPPKQVSTIKFQISQPIVSQQAHCGHLWANLVHFQKHTKSTVTSTIETEACWNSHQRWPL